jgi:MFS family permease
MYGARRIYLIGMGGATVFAGLTALAWDGGSIIGFRVVAAGFGAAAAPASMALINTSFSRERRVQALGYWSLVAAGAPVLGVVVGAPVVESFGWEWIFVAQAPITLVAVIVAFLVLPETPRRAGVRFDVPGTVLIALAVASALVALNRGPESGWSSPVVIAGFVLSPVLIALWVVVERRSPAPLLPLHYLGRRNFAFPMANQFFTNFAYMGGFILTPQLLQEVQEMSLSASGYVGILRPLTFAIAGPVAGWLTLRVGERQSSVFGSTLLVASMLVFATVGAASGLTPVFIALALSGIGMGATAPAMAASIANAVEDRDLGVVGAAQQMISTLGVVAGTQILFTVQQSQAPNGLAGSFSTAYLVGAFVCVFGVVAAAFVHRTPRSPQQSTDPTDPAPATPAAADPAPRAPA